MKRTIFLTFVFVVVATSVSAARRSPIAINDIAYEVSDIDQQPLKTRNLALSFTADGDGTIDCLANTACAITGLHGMTATNQQAFVLGYFFECSGIGSENDASCQVRGSTVGQVQLPGFGTFATKGTVKGSVSNCAEGICDLTLDVKASGSKAFERGIIRVYQQYWGLISTSTSGVITIDDLTGDTTVHFGGQDLGE